MSEFTPPRTWTPEYIREFEANVQPPRTEHRSICIDPEDGRVDCQCRIRTEQRKDI